MSERGTPHTNLIVECEACFWRGPFAEAQGDEALSCPNCGIDESALTVREVTDDEGDRANE